MRAHFSEGALRAFALLLALLLGSPAEAVWPFRTAPRFPDPASDLGAAAAEILARAARLGYDIRQVGVHHYRRTAGEQTGANLKVIVRAFVELFRLRKNIQQTPRLPHSSP